MSGQFVRPLRDRGRIGLGALLVFLLTAAGLWWLLPPRPRATLVPGSQSGSLRLGDFSPDSRKAATIEGVIPQRHGPPGSIIRIWDTATGRPLTAFQVRTEETRIRSGIRSPGLLVVPAVRFSPDGTRLIVQAPVYGTLYVHDATSGRELAALEERNVLDRSSPTKPMEDYQNFGFSPDGRLLAYNYQVEGEICIKLWDVVTQQERAVLVRANWPSVFAPDSRLLATGNESAPPRPYGAPQPQLEEAVELWDVATGNKLATLFTGGVLSLTFSPDGKMLAAHGDLDVGRHALGHRDVVKVWDVATRQELATLEGAGSPAFLPDGRTLVTVDESPPPQLTLWETTTWRKQAQHKVADYQIWGIPQPLPDGKTVAVEANRFDANLNLIHDLKLLDVTTGRLMTILPDCASFDAVFPPDGKTLAVSKVVGGDRAYSRFWRRGIELYDVPPRKPWVVILSVSALVGWLTYQFGRRWVAGVRWRPTVPGRESSRGPGSMEEPLRVVEDRIARRSSDRGAPADPSHPPRDEGFGTKAS